jgi:hypothetical protein
MKTYSQIASGHRFLPPCDIGGGKTLNSFSLNSIFCCTSCTCSDLIARPDSFRKEIPPRSDLGRDCRDTFLALAKTCAKLGISFWAYLGARLAVPDAATIPPLPQLILARAP